jgi:transcriptional regulator with XRE-family HTH domain
MPLVQKGSPEQKLPEGRRSERKHSEQRPSERSSPAENIDLSIGAALRSLRETQGLTARQLADQSGISAAMISRIENAQVSPSIATMTSLTQALDVPLVSLFRDSQSERADFTHIRKGDGIVSTRLVGEHVHHFINLASHRRRDLNVEAHMVTIRKQPAPLPHYVGHGVIFLHVIG